MNNESGVVHPIAEIAQLCHAANVSLHVDAVQAMVVPTLDPARDLAGATSVAISGHKFGAPKGSGALAVRATAPFDSVSSGGGQEFGLRSGTQNVAWAVALATALREQRSPAVLAAGQEFAEQTRRFITAVRQAVPGACLVGPPLDSADAGARSPAVASFVFEGFSGESILLDLERRGVVASSGSACAAGSGEPSHVLKAMGYSADQALTAVRFSFSNPALRAKWAGEAGGGGGGGVGGGGTESRAPLNVERVVAALVAAVDRAR